MQGRGRAFGRGATLPARRSKHKQRKEKKRSNCKEGGILPKRDRAIQRVRLKIKSIPGSL